MCWYTHIPTTSLPKSYCHWKKNTKRCTMPTSTVVVTLWTTMTDASDPEHTLLGTAVHQAVSSQAVDHLPRLPWSIQTPVGIVQFQSTILRRRYRVQSHDVTPLSPIIGTLAVLGRKPCRMVILGTDRRWTDVVGENFADGGTTVYFRLENTNDIWSWKVFSGEKTFTGSYLYIDELDFRLFRIGRTCRVLVAVSVAPAAVRNDCADDVDQQDYLDAKKTISEKQIRKILWMLETNFVVHRKINRCFCLQIIIWTIITTKIWHHGKTYKTFYWIVQ